jgi:hypothetical protein
MSEILTLVEGWCAPPTAVVLGLLALAAVWARLWKAHRRIEFLTDRALADVRPRK